MARAAQLAIWLVALFYAYGASVHVMNILGLSGFDWVSAPAKWKILDVFYLILDVIVAAGLFLNWMISYVSFYVAAVTQIFLYTALREWILDVPEAFAVSPDQVEYLDTLVWFHLVTLVIVSGALWVLMRMTQTE